MAARIQRVIVNRLWRNRVPGWALPLVVPAARLTWLIACPIIAAAAVWRLHSTSRLATWIRLTADGWIRGLHPVTSGSPECPDDLVPSCALAGLDDRHWARLWNVLGSRRDQRLAADKLAMAERLGELGIAAPEPVAELPRGMPVRVESWNGGHRVFIKPRHGLRAQGALSLVQVADSHLVLVSRGQHPSKLMPRETVEAMLTRLAERDSLIVQEFLRASPDLSDLSTDAPVELRLTTARLPGGAARVIAASAKIQPPGYHSATTLNLGLLVPVDPATGVMAAGFHLRAPQERFLHVPWNNARIEGRALPTFARAVEMVETGSRLLPDLPTIGWDVVLSERGPVVLEANTGLSWNFIHLWHGATGAVSPLMPMLEAWLDHCSALSKDSR